MAEKYKWCANEPVVGYKDPDGREYCVFHAPKGEKGMSPKEFEQEVCSRIKRDNERDFSGTVFEEISFTSFDKFNPLKDINFSETTFSGKADFSGAAFSGKAYFHGTTFSGKADFLGTTFSGKAYFSGATFSGKADFHGTTFSGEAYFYEATFSRRAYFHRATFSGEATFYVAIFSGEADFLGAIFSGEASFYGATFSGDAYFSGATFSGEADFSRATFSGGDAYFSGATFSGGDAYFSRATFSERVFFDRTKFKEKSLFERAVFNKHVYFKGKTFFSGGDFQDLNIHEIMRFDGADLSKVTFLDTDMRKIDAVKCTWAGYHNRDALYDEISLYNDPENKGLIKRWKKKLFPDKKALSKVESLYRKLKQKCKEDHDEQQASNWHYCEKEMFRKANLGSGLTLLYCISSGYGEKVGRSAIVLTLLILVLPLLLAYGGLIPTGEGQADLVCINGLYDAFSLKNYQAIVLNTLQFATFQKATIFRPNSHPGEWFKVFTQILIPLQATLFAFAIRNRFRR